MCYFGYYGMYTYGMYTYGMYDDEFFWRIFLWIFFTNFFDEIFVEVFDEFFILLTIASFRIGVPSILFINKNGIGSWFSCSYFALNSTILFKIRVGTQSLINKKWCFTNYK